MIRIVGAISLDRCIGYYPNGLHKKGRLPWEPEEAQVDLEHFKEVTSGPKSIVIMGRKTFESINFITLPGRYNIVVSRKSIKEAENLHWEDSLDAAISHCRRNYPSKEGWNINFIGGTQVFSEGMRFANEIILTIIPIKSYERYDTDQLVYFPDIPNNFVRTECKAHSNNNNLLLVKYQRRKGKGKC